MNENASRKLIALCLMAGVAVVGLSESCIIGGWPVADPCYPSTSVGVGLETGNYRHASIANALEARFRSRGASKGTRLRTDEFKGMYLIVR